MKLAIREVNLTDRSQALIGFGLRAKSVFLGYESVQRGIFKNKVGLILVHKTISAGTLKRIQFQAVKKNIPVLMVENSDWWDRLPHLAGRKILALPRGGLARGMLENLNVED